MEVQCTACKKQVNHKQEVRDITNNNGTKAP